MLAIISFVLGFGLNSTQPIEAFGLRSSLDNAVKCFGPLVLGLAASSLGLVAIFWVNALLLSAAERGGVL